MNTWGLLASIAISFAASFLFAWILYWFDLYEKEPLLLLGGVFLWGAVVAAGGAFIINTVFGVGVYVLTGSETASSLTTAALIAPFIEEILKGFAVLLVFLLFKNEFDSTLDGIVFAGVAALGFAATENVYYIYAYGFLEEGWAGFRSLALIRLGLVGWQHPFYTAFFGIGLAAAHLNRHTLVKIIAPAAGLGAAIAAHALHNILASLAVGAFGMAFTTFLDWFGWFLMLLFIFLVMAAEKKKIKQYLAPEVGIGTLTREQYETASAYLRITSARLKAVFQGRYGRVTRFYRKAAELALKKNLQDRQGDSSRYAEAILSLRQEVGALSRSITA